MKIRRLSSPCDSFDLHLPANKKFDVVGFGLNAVDHLCVVPKYPEFNSKIEILEYARLPGGQVASALIFLSRMGMKVKYIGKVGSDELGQISLRSLWAETIDVSSVRIEQGTENQYAFIIIDRSSGERTVMWKRDPRLNFKEAELKQEDVCAGQVLHLDGHDFVAAQRAASWAQEAGIPVVSDLDQVVPFTKELIEKVDFLIVSSNFPLELTGITDPVDSLFALRQYCRGFIVVTLGAGGAMALLGDTCICFPAFEVPAIDTTGAGDIFHGGFIYGLLQNWSVEKIMAFANAAAGLSCSYMGARAGIRPLGEILQLSGNETGKMPISARVL